MLLTATRNKKLLIWFVIEAQKLAVILFIVTNCTNFTLDKAEVQNRTSVFFR